MLKMSANTKELYMNIIQQGLFRLHKPVVEALTQLKHIYY